MTNHPPQRVILVTVSGNDRPGITSELTGVLADCGVKILDIGQAVIHGLLSLSILFELDEKDVDDKAPVKDLLFKATELGLKLDFRVMDASKVHQEHLRSAEFHYAITLIGDSITARALNEVTTVLAQHKVNIDRIQRLSEGRFGCVELLVSSTNQPDESELKTSLLKIGAGEEVDIALQNEGLFRRSKRLVVFDMDSTLIQNEVIDEFARTRGCYDKVAQITEEAMNGGMEFDQSLLLRCKELEGLTQDDIEKVYQELTITPGAEQLVQVLKRLGYKIALISGGFMSIAERLKNRLSIDYVYANQLEFKNGQATGNIIPPIVNSQRKADLLDVIAQQEGISLDQVIAIGDGANDLQMLKKSGLGIAFNAKATVRSQADLSLNQHNLDSIFYLLGISGRDIDRMS